MTTLVLTSIFEWFMESASKSVVIRFSVDGVNKENAEVSIWLYVASNKKWGRDDFHCDVFHFTIPEYERVNRVPIFEGHSKLGKPSNPDGNLREIKKDLSSWNGDYYGHFAIPEIVSGRYNLTKMKHCIVSKLSPTMLVHLGRIQMRIDEGIHQTETDRNLLPGLKLLNDRLEGFMRAEMKKLEAYGEEFAKYFSHH